MQGKYFLSSARILIARLFCCGVLVAAFFATAKSQTRPLVLLSEETSTRALALESVTWSREPFPLNSLISWSPDPRTRVIVFALNLELQSGDDFASVIADAEDGLHRHHTLTVESAGPVRGQEWMSGLTLRLSDDLSDVGDVLVRVAYKGRVSNRVRVGIGHIGGGLPNDAGSKPTSPYLLRGTVIADGAPLPGAVMTLQGNGSELSEVTDDEGEYLIATIGGDYLLSVSKPFYDFNPTTKAVSNLSQPIDRIDFSGSRQVRTIQGRVISQAGGVEGAVVKLQETGATSISDASGNYSFPGLKAGFDYTVSVTKEDYVFEPATVVVPLIDGNRQLDLHGNPHVFLTGRVVDENGRGIFGVKFNISGTQSGVVATAPDGAYSFLVTAFGSYTLTPWKEQDYYNFTPGSATLTAGSNSRVAEFKALLNASVSPSYVLEFDGSPKTVDYSMTLPGPDYNLFWPDGEDFGHFFWEFWAMPGDNAAATYMISDGYGGAHAILYGVSNFSQSEPGRYQLVGNVWNGKLLTTFGSDDGPAPNEWGHFAAGWDGANIVTYFNGVPVGKTPFVGPRITPGGIQGCGRLLIGGSDHSNFRGRIAQVRGFERNNPREADNGVFGTFRPETVFSVDGNLLSYFFRPANSIADLSLFGQFGRQHSGLLRSTLNGVLYPCDGCPLPQFVVDPTAPDFAHPNNPGLPPDSVDTPAPVPGGALIFDSFTRRNSTYALAGLGGLGSTEGGSAGIRTWQTNQAPGQPKPFGILNARAVLLANATALAWIDAPPGVTDLDIRVNRHAGFWGSGQNTGLSFRVTDAANYFFAYSSDDSVSSQPQKLTVGYFAAGVRSDLTSGVSLPASWKTLRVVTAALGEIRVYADSTLLYSTTSNLFSTRTGVGLFNHAAGLGLTNRWDNFTVYSVSVP